MRKSLSILLAAGVAACPAAAGAQSGNQNNPSSPSDVTVRAPERIVCRPVTRTATRMRVARQCRTVSQWNAANTQSDEERIADSAETLDVLGADDASTGDQGGMSGGHNGPLGPR